MEKQQFYLQVILQFDGQPHTIRFKKPISTTGSDADLLKKIKKNAQWSINLAYAEFVPIVSDVSVCLVDENGELAQMSDNHVAAITQRGLLMSRTPVIFTVYDKKKERRKHPYWVMEYAFLSNPAK